MQLSRRLVVSLVCGVTAVSIGFGLYQAFGVERALKEQVERQAYILAQSEQKPVERMLEDGASSDLEALVNRFQGHDRMAGMAVYDANGQVIAATSGLAPRLAATPAIVGNALHTGRSGGEFLRGKDEPMHAFVLPLTVDGRTIGAIGIFHNTAYTTAPLWWHVAVSAAEALLLAAITLLIVRWSLGKPLQRITQSLRDLRTGNVAAPQA